MRQVFSEERYPGIRYFLGDVRDRDRLYRAFDGVDVVAQCLVAQGLVVPAGRLLEHRVVIARGGRRIRPRSAGRP